MWSWNHPFDCFENAITIHDRYGRSFRRWRRLYSNHRYQNPDLLFFYVIYQIRLITGFVSTWEIRHFLYMKQDLLTVLDHTGFLLFNWGFLVFNFLRRLCRLLCLCLFFVCLFSFCFCYLVCDVFVNLKIQCLHDCEWDSTQLETK